MSEPTLDPDILSQWIGRTESTWDTLDPAHAALMEATLDREPALKRGDPLPAAWHWAWFLSGVRQAELGRDGHPQLGEFLPPVALPRRMWAGNRLTFHKPARLGEPFGKTSTVASVSVKSGRSGTLCFVTVQHDYENEDGEICFSEEHDIVYREDPAPDAPPPPLVEPPEEGELVRIVTPTTTQLFRYSALTFNTHRIHYDRDYCRDVEGYPGLVFHGPLAATMLAGVAEERAEGRKLLSIEFKARAPLFDTQPFEIRAGSEGRIWSRTPEGGVAMMATARYA